MEQDPAQKWDKSLGGSVFNDTFYACLKSEANTITIIYAKICNNINIQ